VKAVTGILGLISLLLAGIVRLILPELSESVTGLMLLGIFFLLFFLFGSRKALKLFLLSHRGKYSLNTTVMILVFISIMLLVNFAGVFQRIRLDTTATGEFTLSSQTKQVLEKIKTEIEVICFFPGSIHYASDRKQAKYLLEEYRYLNKQIRFKFVDPEIRPAIARQYRVRQNGTVVFTDGEQHKGVTIISELAFTNALLQVMGIGSKKIFFLVGHGERDVFGDDDTGFSFVHAGLRRDLYEVKPLNLAQTGTVPDDCAALVIAGPSTSIPEGELKAIRRYLKQNGKLLLLVEPESADTVRGLLAEWGLGVSNGKVIDNASYVVPDRYIPAVFKGNYPPVVITGGLDTSYFPEAAAIMLTDELSRLVMAGKSSVKTKMNWPMTAIEHKNLVILPVLLTSRDSRLETKRKEKTESHVRGPMAMGAMVIAGGTLAGESSGKHRDEKLTRMVVIGDSDFATNRHIQNGGNGDLLLNAVNWITEEEHLISIRPKQTSFPRLVLNKRASAFIRFASLGLLPVLLLLVGCIIWWKKR
jgi:ABC-type uncharacterized transport system involved in gliding motility auxiliary subunit